jgi:hypothetical protein
MSKLDDVLNHMEETTYSFNVPLLSNKKEKVEFRPLKTKDQKLLAVEGADGTSKFDNFTIMLKLLDSCLRKNKTSLGSMLLEDFYWLIINLRIKSLGNTLELYGTCEQCNTNKIPFVLDLEKDMEITYLDGIKNNELKISDKLTLFLKHICLEDMLEILKREEDTDGGGMELSLAYMIDYIEFNEEIIDVDNTDSRIALMDELSADQLKYFKTFLEENAFGMKVKKSFKCTNEKCGEETKVELEGFDIIDFF